MAVTARGSVATGLGACQVFSGRCWSHQMVVPSYQHGASARATAG